MNTLILYATKHGGTRTVAERIATHLNGAKLHDLKQNDIPSLSECDCVIIGSPVYAGTIRKEAKVFLSQNANELQSKKLGLFLCGMSKSDAEKCFAYNFPPEILQSTTAASFLCGIFDPQKANAIERLIMKAVTKQAEYISTVDDEKIAQFAERLSIVST